MNVLTIVLLLFPLYGSCQIQANRMVQRDSTVIFFDILWKFDEKYMITEYADGNYFYKALALPLSEAESNLEGEVLYEIFFMKGEYGEFPDGKLVNIGKFYKIASMVIESNNDKAILHVSHGIHGEVGLYIIE